MVVDIRLVSLKGMVVKRSVEVLDRLLELLILVISQPSLVEYLWVSGLARQGVAQIINRLGILLYVDVDVASLHQEILVCGLSLQGFVQVVQGLLVVLHQTVGLPDSLEDTRVLRSQLLSVQEILDSILVAPFSEFTQLHLGQASQVIGLSVCALYFCSLIEILDGLLIILDVLVDQPPALIHQPILPNRIQDLGQTLKGRCQLAALVLHQSQVIQTGNMVVGNLECLLEHVDRLVVFVGVLVSQAFAVVKLSIIGHQLNRVVEVFMCQVNFLEGQVGVSPVEECSCIVGVQIQGFVVLGKTFIVELIVVEGKSLVIEVCCLCSIQLNGLLEPLQSQVVFLILEVAQSEIVLCWGVVLDSLAGFQQIGNGLAILFDLPIAIPAVEQSLEVGLPCLYPLQPFREILNRVGKVHQPCMDQPSVEVIEPVVGLEADGLLELCEGVVDLVEHHHAVAPIGVVLRVLIIEPDCSSEIIHGLLVVPGGHEGVAPVRVVFGVGGALVVGGG